MTMLSEEDDTTPAAPDHPWVHRDSMPVVIPASAGGSSSSPLTPNHLPNRFSRYLKFARKRQRRREAAAAYPLPHRESNRSRVRSAEDEDESAAEPLPMIHGFAF